MKKFILVAAIVATTFCNSTFALDTLKSLISEGKVSGNLRSYYNTRDYDTRSDEAGYALGGALSAETGSLGIFKFGVTFYTAHDLDLNSDDPAKVNGRLGANLDVLGESFVALSGSSYSAKLGRQKLDSPWANAGDAFITPFTFNGYSFKSTAFSNLTLQADYFTTIRNRNSEEFVDVGVWSTTRFGVAPQATSGTLNLAAIYKNDDMKLQLWYTNFADLFTTTYIDGSYNLKGSDSFKPFVGLQYAMQGETGDALLGSVSSNLYGLQVGAGMGKAKLTLAYNSVAEDTGSFSNGAFLSPYTYSTSPLYTNNMLTSFENVDAGNAIKATLNYGFTPKLNFKLSYATFDFENAADRDAIDADIIYSLSDFYQGVSLRWRVEVITADVATVEVTNHRFQLQFAF